MKANEITYLNLDGGGIAMLKEGGYPSSAVVTTTGISSLEEVPAERKKPVLTLIYTSGVEDNAYTPATDFKLYPWNVRKLYELLKGYYEGEQSKPSAD